MDKQQGRLQGAMETLKKTITDSKSTRRLVARLHGCSSRESSHHCMGSLAFVRHSLRDWLRVCACVGRGFICTIVILILILVALVVVVFTFT